MNDFDGPDIFPHLYDIATLLMRGDHMVSRVKKEYMNEQDSKKMKVIIYTNKSASYFLVARS